MNDPIPVATFLKTIVKKTEVTTVLPNAWIFNKVGNTTLKRKRKNANEVTENSKQVEWINFSSQYYGIKLNREKKAKLLKRLETNPKTMVEDELKHHLEKK